MEIFHKMISAALNLPEKQISNTLRLLAEGATRRSADRIYQNAVR